jgi:Zn-dependent peptidase ImmA (M78 family)
VQRNELVHADRHEQVIYRSPRASEGLDPVEVQANQFAASLLMPARFVRERVDRMQKPLSENGVKALANEFKVSEQAMTIRLTTLGLL